MFNGHAVKERHLNGVLARAAAVTPTLTQAMVGVLSADSLPDIELAWNALAMIPRSVHDIYAAADAG